ncbi:MAG TPA: glycosyltransferase family 39 protein [Acidimicrobiales bacterium]|jgi:4-amino-4-deoxy-L-arabinose transferase-like glycosyltransferase|nr:glycosyltransferase family 39 protein [Acidimicrobiales bacterium]
MTATTDTTRAAPDRTATGLPVPVLGALALAGVVLRWYVLQSPIGGFDADEATSSLVSRQILHGTFTAFIEPLHHGGTALAYPRAPLLALFGPRPLVMKLCEVAVYAAACLVVWRVGRRTFGEREGQLAAGVMWVYPAATVWESTKVMLYYTPAVLLAALALLLCVRLYQDPRDRDVAWLGLVAGLSLWTHPIALYVCVPSVVWLAATTPALLRQAWRAAPGAIVGGLPWLYHNLHSDFASLDQPVGAERSTFWARLEGFFEALLPRIAGLRNQYLGGWYLRPLSGIVYAALFVCVFVAVRHWHGERTLLLAVGLAYPFLFAIPNNSVFVDEPRYGMALLPVLALGVAYTLCRVLRRALLAPAAVLGLAAISLVSLRHVVVETAGTGGLNVLRPPSTDVLWRQLGDEGIDVAYADYWIGMRLEFEDRRAFDFIPVNAYYLDYLDHAPSEGSDVALFYADSPLITRWQQIVAARGFTSDVEVVAPYAIVRSSAQVPLTATIGALDRPG